MELGYLKWEPERTNLVVRKRLTRGGLIAACILVVLYFLLRDPLGFDDPSSRETLIYLEIFVAVMATTIVVGLLRARGASGSGQNLIFPFEENTKEAMAKIINQEVANGELQVKECIDSSTEGKMPYGEKIALTPSYLLSYGEKNKITATLRSKMHWIYTQVRYRGGSHRVRTLVLIEKKIFNMVGVNTEYAEEIVDKIYQYIPNIFNDYDAFTFSHELEGLSTDDHEEFLCFYERECKKKRV